MKLLLINANTTVGVTDRLVEPAATWLSARCHRSDTWNGRPARH